MTPKQIKGFVREWEVGKQILNTCVYTTKKPCTSLKKKFNYYC